MNQRPPPDSQFQNDIQPSRHLQKDQLNIFPNFRSEPYLRAVGSKTVLTKQLSISLHLLLLDIR